MKRDPLEGFKETLEQALFHAEMHTELIRVRPLLRRALNITNDQLKRKDDERNSSASA